MTEENKGAPTEIKPGVEPIEEPKTVEEQLADLQAKDEARAIEFDTLKKTQKGVDTKNSELQKTILAKDKELERIATEHMDAETKLKYDADQKAQALADKELAYGEKDRELAEKSRALLVSEFMLENKVDAKLKKYLTADTVEGLAEQVKEFQEIIETTVQEELKSKLKQPAPKDGVAGGLGSDKTGKLGKTVAESLENLSH